MRFPGILSWFLSAVMAIQSSVVAPCFCMGNSAKTSKTVATGHDGCHKPVGCCSARMAATPCSLTSSQRCNCHCNGMCACVGRCGSQVPRSPAFPPSPRVHADDLAAFLADFSPTILDNDSPAEAVGYGCNSAFEFSSPALCIVLCRWRC